MSTISPDERDWGDDRQDRRGFLRQAGKLLALGAGLAVLPAQAALADQSAKARQFQSGDKMVSPNVGSNCCKTTTTQCPCSGYAYRYYCTDTSGGGHCCYCSTINRGTCFGAGSCNP
jgi:hypothetical protein